MDYFNAAVVRAKGGAFAIERVALEAPVPPSSATRGLASWRPWAIR